MATNHEARVSMMRRQSLHDVEAIEGNALALKEWFGRPMQAQL